MKSTWSAVFAVMGSAALVACGSPSGNDGGAGGGSGGGGGGAGFFRAFTDPGATKVNNGFLVTITGEGFGTDGMAFPPATAGDPYFVDGWEIHFDQILVTLDKVVISDGPDTSPTDQSQTGPVVAELDGPFAVDLAKAGPLDSKGMNGKAWRLGRITNQNKKTGTPAFSATTKYAFGFDLLTAASGSYNVNLDADAQAAYQTMAANGWSVFQKGTATWKGNLGTPTCRSTVAGYDWNRVPKTVNFAFGYKAPVTFKNCINPDLTPADTRGILTQANDESIAQVTFHQDHPLWEALIEDAPLRFDAIAGRKSVATAPAPASVSVTLADMNGIDFQAIKDAQSTAMPIRYCGAVDPGEATTGTLSYNPDTVPVNPAGGSAGLKDLAEYMTYNLSTFGHLNNDGICYPARNFPAP